jgi:oligoribonuclease NrnB/cAMP/cGMP phosphodiesterase (DHH superfamily)
MKAKVIYHSADLDGFCSGSIAKMALMELYGFLPENIEMIGYDYGNPPPNIGDHDTMVVMTDISLPGEYMLKLNERGQAFIWIDHHKTAIKLSEEEGYVNACGVRTIGDSASLLTWNYFYTGADRIPLIVYWVDRYDVWKQGPDWNTVMEAQYGMRHQMSNPKDEKAFEEWLVRLYDDSLMEDVFYDGKTILAYETEQARIKCSKAFDLEFEGLKFAAINNPIGGSTILNSYRREDHQGLMVFSYHGRKQRWVVSMYKNELNEGVDLSEIAKKYGGGGHAGACGFEVDDISTVLNQLMDTRLYVYKQVEGKNNIKFCCMMHNKYGFVTRKGFKNFLFQFAVGNNFDCSCEYDKIENPDLNYVTLTRKQ